MASAELRNRLEELLKRLNIDTICVDHPEVFTVEEMMPHVAHLSGAVTKNLFLKDKKKKSLWLLSVRHDRQLNLSDVAKRLGLGSGNLRLADESLMLEKLKVGQGCATALSVRHDRQLNLSDVAKRLGLGSGNLRLADESLMLEKLKVGQGCATALALFCDTDRSVRMVLDRDLTHGGHQRVYFHPMTNSATMGLKPDDLLRFLQETGHEPVVLSFD
uniref:PrdX deacylase domain-containing protein 1 n=1 Tax=Sinocyclocheilus grahami TaxID=75366 RepID=A0A672PL04_SINGR